MGFEGIPRPAQITPYSDPLNPYLAGNAARTDQAGKPLIQSLNKEEKVKALQKDEQQHHQLDDEDKRGETFTEEEAEQIRLFAKMRGVMNLALSSDAFYEFTLNADTGMVDLIECATGTIVLQLLPEELMQLSQKIQRYAGVLTNRAG